MSDQSTSKTKTTPTKSRTSAKTAKLKKAPKQTLEQEPTEPSAPESIEGELITDSVDESLGDAVVMDAPKIETSPTAEQTQPQAPDVSVPHANKQAVLALGGGVDAGGIEIAGLHENQVSVLQEQHAKGLIEVQRKASELKVDIAALDQTLESLTSQARTANDAGVNITATHTQNTSLGQTEIIVGNTPRAAAGKVAPLWGGFDNPQLRTGLIVGAAVLAGVLLSALFG